MSIEHGKPPEATAELGVLDEQGRSWLKKHTLLLFGRFSCNADRNLVLKILSYELSVTVCNLSNA